MQLLKTRTLSFTLMFAIMLILSSTSFGKLSFMIDSIGGIDAKAKYLVITSKNLESKSLSLSLDAILQAYELALESNNPALIALCDLQTGIVLSKGNNTAEALVSLKRALAYYEESNHQTEIASTLVDIGNAYYFNNQFKKSLIFYNSALAEYSNLSDSLGIVSCYTHIGESNSALENYSIAITYYKDAINIAIRNSFNIYEARNYLNLSRLQLNNGITDSIPIQLNLVTKIAKVEHAPYIEVETYQLYSKYYNLIGDKSEAINYLTASISIKDSLNKVETSEFDNFLNYTSNKGDNNIEESKSTFLFWVIIALLLVGILFLLFRIKNLKTIHNKYITKCTTELEAFNLEIGDLNEDIEQKTKDRFIEIDSEISKNNEDGKALNSSIKKLDQVNYLKDIFLSKISHEIRTPLSGILGFSSILESELALLEDNSLFEFANSISQSGSSLVTLLNNILDISRLNSNNMTLDFKKLNTNELVQGVVDTYQAEASLKGLKLIFDTKDIPDIYTDNHLFSKVLSLILSNSVKFTEKGFIKISHNFDDSSNMIAISIKDTGIGIDKVYINQVFEPFRQESLGYSTSYQGAGLGLPLAKKMSVKLNGNIEIESEKGSGTTITLSFPAHQSGKETTILSTDTTKPQQDTQKNALPWETLSILVVEDDSMNQMLYRKMLKKARILEVAKDGKTALSIVEKQIKNNNFELVLMDINLPAPWDGIKLMNEIRSKWPAYIDIPFIAQTAYAMSGNRKVMIDEGFDDYITKPIIKSTLIEAINSVKNI